MPLRFGRGRYSRDSTTAGYVIKNVTGIVYNKMQRIVTITYEKPEGYRLVENYKSFNDINYVVFDSKAYGRISQFQKYTEHDDFDIDMQHGTEVDVSTETEQRGALFIVINKGGRKDRPIDTGAKFKYRSKETTIYNR